MEVRDKLSRISPDRVQIRRGWTGGRQIRWGPEAPSEKMDGMGPKQKGVTNVPTDKTHFFEF